MYHVAKIQEYYVLPIDAMKYIHWNYTLHAFTSETMTISDNQWIIENIHATGGPIRIFHRKQNRHWPISWQQRCPRWVPDVFWCKILCFSSSGGKSFVTRYIHYIRWPWPSHWEHFRNSINGPCSFNNIFWI